MPNSLLCNIYYFICPSTFKVKNTETFWHIDTSGRIDLQKLSGNEVTILMVVQFAHLTLLHVCKRLCVYISIVNQKQAKCYMKKY